jgi:hypothetical protein
MLGSGQTEKGETGKEQNEQLSSRKAKQTIPHATVTFYGDCVKMCEDFVPNFGDKILTVATRQLTVSHFLFHQKQHDCRSPSILPFSAFPD